MYFEMYTFGKKTYLALIEQRDILAYILYVI